MPLPNGFERMPVASAADARVELRQIEAHAEPYQFHPLNGPETDYLKFTLFQWYKRKNPATLFTAGIFG